MSRVSINRDDKERILLTEVLPYEVPILFSNDGFYKLIHENKYSQFFDKVYELSHPKKYKFKIPFDYEIRKNSAFETRTVSIMHPLCQKEFIDLYKDYDSLMIHLCSKSPLSLRRISKVAKYYYSPSFVFPEEDPLKNPELEVEPEFLDSETKYLKSYFVYEPLDLIYKFYEDKMFRRLEQRFSYMIVFDISKCFYNIYTHSIAWAIKSKEVAKKNTKVSSFENQFDELIRLANYGETNGIIVGPEVSRIFAEIILQQIDINALNRLGRELKYGVDFEIKRYIDDYFVFSNDERVLEDIKRIFSEELAKFKLYVNPSKIELKKSPFVTDASVAKNEIKKLLISLFEGIYEDIEIEHESDDGVFNTENARRIKRILRPFRLSDSFIKDFQYIAKSSNVSYDVVSKDVVRLLKNKLSDILRKEYLAVDKGAIEHFFLMFYDILFYAYSLNINSSTTFKVAQMIVLTCKFLDNSDKGLRYSVYKKIASDAKFLISIYKTKSTKRDGRIEMLNLIIALKMLGENFLFSQSKLISIFELDENELESSISELNYFHIITLLYYIEDNDSYKDLRLVIEASVIEKFQKEEHPFVKSELTMLFFDFINCPYVDNNNKKELMGVSKYSSKEYSKKIAEIKKQKQWFMNWDKDIDLERILKKKEWGSSY